MLSNGLLPRLTMGSTQSTAEQCRKLGLVVGDTILGREEYQGGWNEARLTLLWLGEQIAVFREQSRSGTHGDAPPPWLDYGETASWTLEYRRWRKVQG